jgi:hypothetical protein
MRLRGICTMKIILTVKEQNQLRKLQYIGKDSIFKVYDLEHKTMLKVSLLCDCGEKDCEPKKLLLIKLLKEME